MIKVAIIIILKYDLEVDQGKTQVTSQEIKWIKIIIIIILKPDSGVDRRQDSGHGAGRVKPLDPNFILKIIKAFLFRPIFFQKF
jgi:hypothetical protein